MGTSIHCREQVEDKADGAQKPESRQVGMKISSTDQRSIRVAQQINSGGQMPLPSLHDFIHRSKQLRFQEYYKRVNNLQYNWISEFL